MDPSKLFPETIKTKTVKYSAELGWLNVGDWVKVSSEWLNIKDLIGHVYLIFS